MSVTLPQINAAHVEIGRFLLEHEGRLDAHGELAVYPLPEGDGGGTYEVAGINDRYHPEMAAKLRALIERGEQVAAKAAAIAYMLEYTRRVAPWHGDPRVTAYLRDLCFNRGPSGAAEIFQRALAGAGSYRGRIDRKVGPMTRAAAARHGASDLVLRLAVWRVWYERERRDETSRFWDGLVNRWVDIAQLCLGVGDPWEDFK